MPTARRSIELLLAAALSAAPERSVEAALPGVIAGSAAAQEGPVTDPAKARSTREPGAPEVGTVVAEGALGSLRKLLEKAAPMAKEWSQDAALYSAYGRAPRNAQRWENSEWGMIFGDPKARDGSFHIVFSDGAIRARQGIKGGVKMVDSFKEGEFLRRDTGVFMEYSNADYAHCKPVHADFVDLGVLEKRIREQQLLSDSLGQYGFSLLRPLNDQCDGLGRQSLYLRDKPIPLKLRKRTLWTIHTPTEVVYIDARTGKIALRRPL